MLSLHVNELSEYSRSVARLISKHRPAWLAHATAIEIEGTSHKALEVRIPNENPIGPIIIVTDRDEMTVWASEYFHHHFSGDDGDFEHALYFIDNVMSEEFIIYWVSKDKNWVQSGFFDSVRFDLLKDVPVGDHHVVTRSWAGSRDREYDIDFSVFGKLWY
ncbi:hypothetical protein [Bosea sp. BK604]|uniref:hypothetical protein n=1 Tax=Bosea sp. BK604 TaxID=2512180 RepID=UPI0010436CE8|nr:hypothetical protein [Bosea sp. BK604]